MTNNFSKILTGVAICAASTVAFANGDNFNSTTSYAKPGFSVGIDGGYGYLSSPEEMYPNDFTEDHYKYQESAEVGDFVWGVHINYDFKIKPYMLLGFEFGYKDLGSSNNHVGYYEKIDSTEWNEYYIADRGYQQNAIDLLLTTHIYFYKGANIFAKAGAAYVRSNINQSIDSSEDAWFGIPTSALSGDNDIWRIEPEVSLGVGYTFNNHVDIHAAYTYIGGANDQPIITSANMAYLPENKVYSTNMITAGISYTF